VTRQVRERLLSLYAATPDPKLVIAVGSCATCGGIWHESYATLGGLSNVLPVSIYIPGCPPRPEAIIYGVAQALGLVPKQVEEQVFVET
jgi:Ni,Fe-hydrogenase III small subunit